jgi:hypothetical protein
MRACLELKAKDRLTTRVNVSLTTWYNENRLRVLANALSELDENEEATGSLHKCIITSKDVLE